MGSRLPYNSWKPESFQGPVKALQATFNGLSGCFRILSKSSRDPLKCYQGPSRVLLRSFQGSSGSFRILSMSFQCPFRALQSSFLFISRSSKVLSRSFQGPCKVSSRSFQFHLDEGFQFLNISAPQDGKCQSI